MEFTEKDINNLIEERNRLAHENEILYKKIDDLEDEKCSDLKKYISVLEKRLKDSKVSNCEDLKKKIVELENELDVLNENEERYEKIFNQQKANIEKWKNKYEKTEVLLKEKIAENEQLKLEKEGLLLEIESLKNSDCEDKYKSLRSSFDILLNEYEGATKSIKALKEELKEERGWKSKYLALAKKTNKEVISLDAEKITETMIEILEHIIDKKYDNAAKAALLAIKEAKKIAGF